MLRCEYLVNEYNMLSHAYNTCNVSVGNCSACMVQSPGWRFEGKVQSPFHTRKYKHERESPFHTQIQT